jgi:hypothetical protein
VSVAAATPTCTTSVITVQPDQAVWAACTTNGTITGVPAGFTKAADDGHGDWSAYELKIPASGTAVPAPFTEDINGPYVIAEVGILQ